MLIKHQLFSLAVGVLLSGISFWPKIASAQMTVSPVFIETQAKRSQAQGVISVTNIGDTVLRARVYAEPFTYTDTGVQFLEPGQGGSDLIPYLQFSPTELVIPPGATRRIRLISRFPPNLPDGEYRAMIFTERLLDSQEVPGDSNGNSDAPVIKINARIGSAFYVRQGNITSNLSVVGASWNSNQQRFQLLLENAGSASEHVRVDWQLKRGEAPIMSGSLPTSTVVAQSQRHLQLRPANPDTTSLPAGDYQLVGEVSWEAADRPQRLPFNLTVTIPSYSSP